MTLLPALTSNPPAALLSAVAALAYSFLAWAHPRLSERQTRNVLATAWVLHIHQVEVMVEELKSWMKKKGCNNPDDFRGKLSRENMSDPFAYKRAQYVDILMKSEMFLQYHPKRREISKKEDI